MAYRIIKSGLIGMVIGLGFGNGFGRESAEDMVNEAWENREACRYMSMIPGEVYKYRTLGRAESHHTGISISGGTFGDAGVGSGGSRQVYSDHYQLRSIGRVESRLTDRDIPPGFKRGGQAAVTVVDPKADIYRLRAKGRDESRETGTDYCALDLAPPDRFGSL